MPSSFTREKSKGILPIRRESLGVINESERDVREAISLKKRFPGDFPWDEFDGSEDDSGHPDTFDSIGFDDIYFNTTEASGWFRDTGSTTTQEQEWEH